MTASRQVRATGHLGPSGRAALHLLACGPRLPTDVVGVLLGLRHAASAAQLLARLRKADLADYQTVRPGPLLGSRPVRLWTLSASGRAVLDARGLAPPAEDRRHLPYGEPDDKRDVARQRDLPMLIAAYCLLADVVRGLDRPVRVRAWEHPWSRTFRTSQAGHLSRVRLPAAAVLFCEPSACSQMYRLLLVPDVGTAPLSSYSTALRRLLELRQEANVDERDEPLLVVGVATAARSSGVRSEAWRSLLNQIARRAGARPVRADILVRGEGLVSARCEDRRSPSQADEVFALIARHPLLTRQQLATLLDTSSARVAQLVSRLVDSGWLRPLLLDPLLMHGTHGLTGKQLCRLGLVELTAAGRREAARRLLVHAGLARRRHGILQDDAARRRFLRHLQHTLGTNAVFVALASAAWRVRARGGDDALEEWRAAAACARGRFRPDGYGCYRRGLRRFGFFLEYDRGTERPRHYGAKLAAYYRYRDSGAFTRDYDGFPMLLVVTTSEEAESQFLYQAYLAERQRGSEPLSVLFTTTRRIADHADGLLGPIWRAPGSDAWTERPARIRWLPALPRSPTAEGAVSRVHGSTATVA